MTATQAPPTPLNRTKIYAVYNAHTARATAQTPLNATAVNRTSRWCRF